MGPGLPHQSCIRSVRSHELLDEIGDHRQTSDLGGWIGHWIGFGRGQGLDISRGGAYLVDVQWIDPESNGLAAHRGYDADRRAVDILQKEDVAWRDTDRWIGH